MKAATGNAMLMNIIITFLVVVLALLVASISYTKAFRVKNRIVDTIEYYDGDFTNKKDIILNEINTNLNSVGYRRNNGQSCPKVDKTMDASYSGSDYYYCIYEYNTERGRYYKVIAYMYLDLPIVGDYINIPVNGETKVFYN